MGWKDCDVIFCGTFGWTLLKIQLIFYRPLPTRLLLGPDAASKKICAACSTPRLHNYWTCAVGDLLQLHRTDRTGELLPGRCPFFFHSLHSVPFSVAVTLSSHGPLLFFACEMAANHYTIESVPISNHSSHFRFFFSPLSYKTIDVYLVDLPPVSQVSCPPISQLNKYIFTGLGTDKQLSIEYWWNSAKWPAFLEANCWVVVDGCSMLTWWDSPLTYSQHSIILSWSCCWYKKVLSNSVRKTNK